MLHDDTHLRRLRLTALLILLPLLIGCSTRQIIQSIPTQAAHEVLGQRTYVHPVAPPKHDLLKYRIIAVQKLENLMLDEIPAQAYDRLNQEIVENISHKKLFTQVLPITDPAELQGVGNDAPVLLLDGYLDNYNPGSEALRLAEMGLNHAVVTVRIELKDAQTGDVLGSASISVYERGVTRTQGSAVHKTAKTVAEFIEKEMALAKKEPS